MPEPIVYVDQSEVREGRLSELQAAMNALTEFVEANEPRIIAYNVYFGEDGKRMTVFHMHPDAASLEFHLEVAGPLFRRVTEFIRLLRIDVYGTLSDDVVERMRQKAQMLGDGKVLVHERHAGFARFRTR